MENMLIDAVKDIASYTIHTNGTSHQKGEGSKSILDINFENTIKKIKEE